MSTPLPAAPAAPPAGSTAGAKPQNTNVTYRLLLTLVFAAAAAIVFARQFVPGMGAPPAIAYGFLAAGLLYILSTWITNRLDPMRAAIGEDGRLSTSKFQFLLWTAVVVFTYAWFFAVRAQAGTVTAIDDLPANVLLAMGFSATTLATAKGITLSYVRSGQIDKPVQPEAQAKASNLLTDDAATPDLTKIQMLVWTFIAAVVYLAQVATTVKGGTCAGGVCDFPDIDAALMVLMGLGQGAYLGNKLVTVDTPRITSLQPAAGAPGTEVTIRGEAFGASPQVVTLDGVQVPVDAGNWQDGAVKVTIPRKQPSGANWPASYKVKIGMMVTGRRAVGVSEFQILPPAIEAVVPATGAAASDVTLRGSAFGAAQADAQILLDGVASDITATTWADNQIQFKLPAGRAAGPVKIAVRANGLESGGATYTVTA